MAKSSVGRLLDFLSPLGKERVGGRLHLKVLLVLPGVAWDPWPVTQLRSSSSTGKLPFIHLLIMSGCQAGAPPSQESLRFYSKFCKFFSASWLQMRLCIAQARAYRRTRPERGESSGRLHGVTLQPKLKRYAGPNYRLGRSAPAVEKAR